MIAKKIVLYQCPLCGNIYDFEGLANECIDDCSNKDNGKEVPRK